MSSFLIQGKVVSITNGQPVPYAKVQVFQVHMPGYTTSLLTTTSTHADGTFSAPFPHPSPPRPNVILRVSQTVGGITTYIYSENPHTDTRFSIADVVNVTLKASGTLVTSNPSPTPQPTGDEFLFTRVGNIVTGSISQTNGYAYPNEGVAPYPFPTQDSDAPFGGTLWIGGWFGVGLTTPPLGAQYYKVQWAPGIQAASGAGPWTDVTDPLSNSYFDFTTENWISQSMGPTTVGGVIHLYQLPNNPGSIPWAFPDLLAQLDTTKLPTGPVTLRAIGYTGAAVPGIVGDGTLATWLSTYVDPAYGSLKLQIDNTPPASVSISGVNINGGAIPPCGTAILGSSATDYLEIDFEASDTLGHLRDYTVDAIWGANHYVMPPPSPPPPGWNPAYDNYSAHINGTNQWAGSASLATRYYGSQYNSSEMGPCAYDFRLRVDKRTTNGYGLVYYGYEYDFTIILTRS
ncbi:MAG: hypothetical protein ABSB82_06755 [Terriglobia bacterium]|jgi:hypothetical protein